MKRILFLSLAILSGIGTTFASWPTKVQGIWYDFDESTLTAEVTHSGYVSRDYKGRTTIPASVTYEGKTYSVTSIGERAFYDCYNLTFVGIPNSVTSIGKYAFYNCSLTSITIPNSVASIGDDAFSSCSDLTSVYISDITAWCTISFGNDKANPLIFANNLYLNETLVTDLVIPNNITSIGETAFFECTNLTSVTIGNSVTSIGGLAFWGCSSLTSITIGNSVTSIGGSAFGDCTSLTSVTIPNSVTSIGGSAFGDCTSLTSITIGNSVTSIGRYAFGGCINLASITCAAVNPPAMGENVFWFVKYSIPLYVPTQSINAYQTADQWKEFTNIQAMNFDPEPENYSHVQIGNLYYNLDALNRTTEITSQNSDYPYWTTNITMANIPSSVTYNNVIYNVTSIGEGAFYECTSLTSVTIPNSVINIGVRAFDNCIGLTSVTIPNSVTSIGSRAFSDCYDLTSITCEAAYPPTLGGHVFQNINKSIPLYVPEGSITAYKTAEQWKDFYNIQPIESEERVSSFAGFEAKQTLVDQINNENLIQDLMNVTVVQTPNQNYKHTINLINGGEGAFTMGGVTFSFTHEEAGKIAYKTYNNYIQPNGIDREIRIPTYKGQSFKIILTEDCDGILIDGVSTNLVAGDNIITASKDGTTIKNPSNKPKINGILPLGGSQDINNVVQDDRKLIAPRKVMIDNQILIHRGEKIYTIQGKEVK